MEKMTTLFILFTFLVLFSRVLAQAPEAVGTDSENLAPVQPETNQFRRRERLRCNKSFREFTGVCTSRGGARRKLWGSTNRPQFSYFNLRSGQIPRGNGLKSAREISNIIFKQTGDIFDERGLSDIATFFGQFIDHTLVATPGNKDDNKDLKIPIPEGDTDALDASQDGKNLEFTRSKRVRVKDRDSAQRAQNSLTSAMDLVNVYGPSEERNDVLREKKDGLMRVGAGNLLPENERLVNAPRTSNDFFLAGDHRSNEHPVLTSLHTLFLREHNSIARELKAKFPELTDDEELFQESRKINEAQWQKIVFEEWYPAVTGRKLPRYRGFRKGVDPTVSLIFSTAAFRVGHTMVSNTVKRFRAGNVPASGIPLIDAFFPGIAKFKSFGTVEDFLRGALNSRAQRVDSKVVDGLRNGLFKDISGEDKNFDLIALNLQRGRDHAIPNYAAVKVKFNKPKPRKFRDITRNKVVQKQLQNAYGSVSKVEAFPGLMAEDLADGSSLGRTLLKIWEREFRRIRDGDRFFFRNKGALKKIFIQRVPRLKDALRGKDVFRAIILRNTDIKDSELPKRLFFV